MDRVDDDFWDYDRQVDLEAFSTKQLFSDLSNQSQHVISTIDSQKEQVYQIIIILYCHDHSQLQYNIQAKALFMKISTEAENLRNLWVSKLNLQGKLEMASPEDLRTYENIKEEVKT